MLRDGFLRFCDDPDIACCRAEAELGKLRIENGQLYAELAELQELDQAKADGRLIELPCKIGDTVYVIYGKNKILETKVDLRFWNDDDGWILRTKEGRFYEKCIGKTVFLTREEAEKALEVGE